MAEIGGYTVEVEIVDKAGDVIGTITCKGGRPDHQARIDVSGFVANEPLDYVWGFFEVLAKDIRESGHPERSDA